MPVGDSAPDAYIRRTDHGRMPQGSESTYQDAPGNGPSGDHAPDTAVVPQGTNHTTTMEATPSGTENVSQGGSPGVGTSGVDSDGDYDDD